jgi:hypothetical protein
MKCPYCKIPLFDTRPPISGRMRLGLCTGCGHLVGNTNEIVKVDFKILHDQIRPELRKKIYERQEKLHFKLGHWG